MADLAPELPHDVINQVLLHLPTRSIGRFRCVSKPWRSHLSSPQFAQSHFNFRRRRAAPTAIRPQSLLTFPADGGDGRSRQVACELIEKKEWNHVVAVCNGFVLYSKYPFLYVLNPTTLEYSELPYFDSPVPHRVLWHDGYGMGYDSLSGDFKIVQVSGYATRGAEHLYDAIFVDVYSFKNKCWNRIAQSPYRSFFERGVYMNGCLHWMHMCVIVAFNLGREEFEEIPFPKEFGDEMDFQHIAVLRECIAIICEPSKDCFDVWLMKEYGVQESWQKLVVSTPGRDFEDPNVLFLSREDELFFMEDQLLFAYSLTTGILRNIVVGDVQPGPGDGEDDDDDDPTVFTFTECLLSPNHL